MASTFLNLTNVLLDEVNEVRLTSANFATARNIQRYAKECINKAYMDIHMEDQQWPWMSIAEPQDNYYGNTYIETVAGTRWYLANAISTSLDEDYGSIELDKVTLTEEGVAGKTSPYTIENLANITQEEWKDHFSRQEAQDKSGAAVYGVPKRVMRSADGRRFGLSPIPDGVYRVYFQAYDQVTELSTYDDTCLIPKQYENALISRARYYIWKFKDTPQQAAMALDDYKKQLRRILEALNPMPEYMSDDRVRFV